ncbi:MAG TPA: tetratricopeptide repeat protein [Candidatus Acidoferrum sp.]|nr:tetratricopeptide repeat protein [Candidatus Acidoferrum sp.]
MNRFLARSWPPYVLLGLAVLLVWGQTIWFDFVWDDEYFIRDLPSVRSLSHIPEMFYRLDAQATLPDDFRVFRPIRTAHYALLHSLAGREIPPPWIYHLANVLWHAGTVMMLFAVLTALLPRLAGNPKLEESRLWSFWVALAFAVHPVVSEVVCWAKSLDDILAAFFTLASLRELVQPPGNRGARWRALAFFALAVYSKESAVPFAAVAFVCFRKVQQLPWKESLRWTVPFFVIAAVYLAHRHWVIGRSSQTAPISGSYGQTLLDMLPVVLKYFRLLWGVPPFFIDYSYLPGRCAFWSGAVLGGLALLAVLVAIGFAAARNPKLALLGFGLLWTGLFLLPVSNLVPMMQYMAERFLYLPLIGWLMGLAAIAAVAPRPSRVRLAAFLLVSLWGITAWNRSWIWRDPVTLFVRSAQEGPKTQRVENNAVSAILHLPSVQQFLAPDKAGKKMAVSESADPAAGRYAVAILAQANQLFPTNQDILSTYGVSLAAAGEPEKALPLLKQAAEGRPQNLDHWLNLSRAALAANQVMLAQSALDKAASLTSTNAAVLQLSFKLYWQTGNYPAARETLLQLNQLAPGDENAYWLNEVEKKLSAANQPATNAPPIK